METIEEKEKKLIKEFNREAAILGQKKAKAKKLFNKIIENIFVSNFFVNVRYNSIGTVKVIDPDPFRSSSSLPKLYLIQNLEVMYHSFSGEKIKIIHVDELFETENDFDSLVVFYKDRLYKVLESEKDTVLEDIDKNIERYNSMKKTFNEILNFGKNV